MFDRRFTRLAASSLLLLAAACGESTDSSIEVTIEQPVPSPRILSFEALPDRVTPGGPATLHWATRDAASIVIEDGSGAEVALSGADRASGSVEVLPAETTFYTLTANGSPGAPGPVWRTVTVAVEAVTPDAPVIEGFTASAQEVLVGGEVVLSWRTVHATRLTLKDDAGAEIDLDGANVEEGEVAVRPSRQATSYSLRATGPGGSASAVVAVTVTGLPRVTQLYVDPIAPVGPGESITLFWETLNTERVVITRGDETVVDTTTELSGSRVIVLDDSAEFVVVASGGGQAATARALARVGPRIVSFAASNRVVRLGDPVDLAWQLEGADRAVIEGPGDIHLELSGAQLASGTATVYLADAGDIVLRASRGDVARTGSIAVETTGAPRVRSLALDQQVVTADALHPATVTLAWIQDGADACTIYRNDVAVEDFVDVPCSREGSATIQVFGPTRLRFVASNAAGSHSSTGDVQAVKPASIVAFAHQPARRLTPGSTVELSWTVTDAVSISMEKNGAPLAIGSTDFAGTAIDRVDLDSTYTLTALNSLGTPTVETIEVRAGDPAILVFEAEPSFAAIGSAIVLRWAVDGGEVLTVTDHAGTELFRTTDPAVIAAGSLPTLVPVVAGTYGYTLTSTNGVGTRDIETARVIVSDGPMIDAFTANKPALSLGETLTLSWSVQNDPAGNVPALTLTDNYANTFDLTGQNPNLGSITITPVEEGPHVFTLTASTGSTRMQATATAGTAAAPIEVTVPPRAIAFTATPDRVGTGGGTVLPDVTLAWQTENAVEVTLWESDAFGGVFPPPFHRISLANGDAPHLLDAGSLVVHPTASTWYVLRVKNRVGSFVDRKLKVIVDPPEILSLDSTPPQLVEGQPAQLNWTTRYADYVVFDPPNGPLQVSPSQFPFVDISSTGTASTLNGDCGNAVINFPAGFTFPFDGVARSAIWVTSNGLAGFDLTATTCDNVPVAFPANTKRYVQLAPYWCDLDNTRHTPVGKLWYGLHVDAMGEYLVIQWKNWSWWSSSYNPSTLNFEIILRRSGVIEYRYGSMSAPTAERAAGQGCGIGYQYPSAGSPAANIFPHAQAVAGGLANKGWVLGSQLPANGSLAVTPSTTTTYSMAAVNADTGVSQQYTLKVWKNPSITGVRLLPAAPEATKPFQIEWTVAEATRVRVLDGSGVEICNEIDPAKVLTGSCTHVEPTAGFRTYTIEAMNGPLQAPMVTVTRPFNVSVYNLLALDSFTVTPGEFVASGTPVTITWAATGATEFELFECKPNTDRTECVDITPAGVDPNAGSYTQTMTHSAEFWLRVLDVASRARQASKAIWVDAPSVDSLTATATQIPAGASTTLTWTSTGAGAVSVTPPVAAAPAEVTSSSPYVEIATTGTAATLAWGNTDSGFYDVQFPVGWVFPWFGSAKSAVRVSTDGWLTFNMAYSTAHPTEVNMPAWQTYRGVNVAPFWDDLKLAFGDVYWKADADAQGVKYVVIEWKGAVFASSTYNPANLNFQTVLWETGDIELRYGTMFGGPYPNYPKGDSAAMGWQNTDLYVGKMLTANAGDVVSAGLQNRSWKFTLGSAPDSGVTVTPADSTTYKVCASSGSYYTDCEELRVVVVKPGDILFSEAMIAPATDDAEWFELRNVTAESIDLAGWTILSGTTETFAVPATPPLVLPPGRFAVFARTAAAGLAPTLVYGTALGLDDVADDLKLQWGSTVIDGLAWSGTAWPIQAGQSIALEPSVMARSMAANDAATAWCATAASYGDGTYFGSPGALGSGCLTSGAYQWYELDAASGTPFIDIEKTGVSIISYDAASPHLTPSIPLGFSMPYFGDTVSSIQVNTMYGYIAFTPQTTLYSSNAAMPNPAQPNGFVAPFWDQLLHTPNFSAINYQAMTIDGHQVMIVQWARVGPGSTNYGTLDLQVQFWDTGDVAFVYRNFNKINPAYGYLNGSSATIGMENIAGLSALQIYYGNTASGGGPIVGSQSYLFRRR